MSIQTNQYLIYGINVPVKWIEQWKKKNKDKDWYETFESFMDDSAFTKKVKHKDGIFCLYDGMSGKFLIIGKVLDKSEDGELLADHGPMSFDERSESEKKEIADSIQRNFGISGEIKHWLVTMYR